jgi:SAM-dependent methyltransferase
MNSNKYLEVNKDLWNGKTDIHIKSNYYDMDGFKAGKTSLNPIELEALGDVKGKSILHLQCHFGLDSLSLARLEAKVTAIDFSDRSIEFAKNLNQELGLDVKFICTDIYSLPNILEHKFDIVFTSYGTIVWLPDLDKWASVISKYLKPNGEFFIVDGHPFAGMYDKNFEKIIYSYFNLGPDIEEIKGTYADKSADFVHLSYQWSHSMSEIIMSLIKYKLQIVSFMEFPFIYKNSFKSSIEEKNGHWMIKGLENKIPLLFSIKARKL